MTNVLGRFTDPVYAVARLVIGFLFACHGAQKLFGVLGGHQNLHAPLMLVAGIVEFFGGVMIAIGLAASIAALLASGEMAVAGPRGFWPIQNAGEPAVFYCFFFLFVAAYGSGRYSVDGLLRGGKR